MVAGFVLAHRRRALFAVPAMSGSLSVSPRKNPKGPEKVAHIVLRGGTFFVDPLDLRTYTRSAAWPSSQAHRMIGFRGVREP